jgi:hypothetical protein
LYYLFLLKVAFVADGVGTIEVQNGDGSARVWNDKGVYQLRVGIDKYFKGRWILEGKDYTADKRVLLLPALGLRRVAVTIQDESQPPPQDHMGKCASWQQGHGTSIATKQRCPTSQV